MKKFRVPFSTTVTVMVTIEAIDKDEAVELAWGEVGLTNYVGNGGYDKLIGVSSQHMSVEANDYFECEENDVQEIED